jgi:YfiH family protein
VSGPGWIIPEWPAPPGVRAVATLRSGGTSVGPFASLNLGDHVGDDPAAVAANRARLVAELGLALEPCWLRQVHGTTVVEAAPGLAVPPEADAAVTGLPGLACAVLTADCLPVLLARRDGSRVGAAHAGWRGLVAGVVEATVARLCTDDGRPGDVLAWLGPAIGPGAYEVGADVREALLAGDPGAGDALRPGRPGHWWLDLYAAARRRLARAGVTEIHGGAWCTATEAGRFFSYRRDGTCGRQATLIWRG